MLIGQSRLLLGLQRAVEALADGRSDPATQMVLTSARTLLHQLGLHNDTDFQRAHLQRGLALQREAPASVPQQALQSDAPQAEAGALGAELDALRRHFETRFRDGADASSDWGRRVFAWEAQTHLHEPAAAADKGSEFPPIPTAREVEAYLCEHYADASLRLREFRPLVGGLQKLTILVETDGAAGPQSLVLRGEQPDRFFRFDLGEVPDEYEFIRLVFDTGLPVPEPLWVERDATRLGRRFLISRRAVGVNYGSATGVDSLPRAAAKSLVETLARFHAIPVGQNVERIRRTPMQSWLPFPRLRQNTAENLRRWIAALDQPRSASPALGAIQHWLTRNLPDDDGPCTFVHCDYAPHNVLIEGEQVSAVLDWESARIGDPAEDVGYLLGRCGPHIDRAEALHWYAEAGGPAISEYRLRYYDVFHMLKLFGAAHLANALYAGDAAARNEWTPLAFQFYTACFGMPWQSLIEAAESCRR